ncbi:MAG: TrmB family transcriptional regulator [Candidatus Nanoarchaeia archaeon]
MDVYSALGLSEGEKKVYRALVKLGSTTTGPLYKQAGVSQSKVYEILDRLKKKGLAASILKRGVRYWQAANPDIYLEKVSRELEDLEERKAVLEDKLPTLLSGAPTPTDEAQVLVGYNGFRTALFSFLSSLSSGDEFLVFGSPKPIPEPFRAFLKAFNKDRVKQGVKARFLYGESLRKFAKEMYSIPKTKVRFMEGLTPSSIAIGKDRIIIITWREGGKCIVVQGKEIAESYRVFFESLWKMSHA